MTTIELSRWVAAGLFATLFILVAATNVHVMFIAPRRLAEGARGPSPVPMVGGFFGVIACLTAPDPTVRWFAWLPLVLDPGCLLLIGSAWQALRREEEQSVTVSGTPQSEDLRHAATGCLLGTAVGDALGLAGEGLSRRRLRRLFPDVSRYHFFAGKGWCSDDTEHAGMTAQAFLAAQQNRPAPDAAVFAHALAAKLRWWLLGLPAGIGLATGRSIIKLWFGWSPEKSGVPSAGNGPAMRAPILGVLLGHDPAALAAFIRASTRLTHTDPKAEHGALAVAWAAHCAARARIDTAPFSAPDAARALITHLPSAAAELAALITSAGASVAAGDSTEKFATAIGCEHGVSGYMLHTVPVALHAAWSHPLDLPTALGAAIRCGGDTDSVAALVGGIVGARVGRAGIPAPLLDDLWEWPRSVRWMERLGAMLAATRAPNRVAFPLRLNIPGVLARNVFFLVLVLAHGLRRLLPPW
jgi:ADP-ribosyl-[dinitrogen reductase] hydrolase